MKADICLEGCHLNMKAGAGGRVGGGGDATRSQECQKWPANPQKLEEGQETEPSSQPLEGTNPEDTLLLDF